MIARASALNLKTGRLRDRFGEWRFRAGQFGAGDDVSQAFPD